MNPDFKNGYPFSKDLFVVEMGKTMIKMSKQAGNIGPMKTLSMSFISTT